MSIKKIVLETIENLRQSIAVWDNPASTSEAKGHVLATLVGDDPHFWTEVAKRATIKPASTKRPTKVQIERAVAEMKTVATPLASKETTITLASVPTAPASKPVRPSATAPATVAPRTLAPTPDQKKDKLISILSGFIEANKRIDGEKTRRLLDSVVNSVVEISEADAALILKAARKANNIGFYLIDRGSSDIFYCASVEAVDNYVFGQDGEMVQILAGLAESEGKILDRLAARIFILLTALGSLKERGALGEFEISRIETLQTAVSKIGYKKIEDVIEYILRQESELEKIHRQAQVPNYALAGIVEIAAQLERVN